MKQHYKFLISSLLCLLFSAVFAHAQITVKGKVRDADTGEDLIGVSITLVGATGGTLSNYDGEFYLKVPALPVTVRVSYTGYESQEIAVSDEAVKLDVRLASSTIVMSEAIVVGQRIDDKQKAAPLTIENLDAIAIKQTAAVSFYNGLGNLKGVDLTTASLGFTIINTRGFNSTSPVRSLQIIDGVDNQAPGLNFSLGNFLGASDLDVIKVDLIQGASSAFYGPNAFNGVISMETKNPFVQRGLAGSVKYGSRNLAEAAIRWAEAFKNKNGDLASALKINLFYLRADDWVAQNYGPVDGTDSKIGNPGRWDAVNTYGDEYFSLSDFSDQGNLSQSRAGLGVFHRTGYREEDLVDYDTKNLKAGLAYHIRTNPSKEFESPEIIFASNFGTGTTVYQGDNRFSLRGIKFFQNRLEFRKKDKYFIRAYATHEDAGRSFDPYFTALRLQSYAKSDETWSKNYNKIWGDEIYPVMRAQGYPDPIVNFIPEFPFVTVDYTPCEQWLAANQDSLTAWHQLVEGLANLADPQEDETRDFLVPGTEAFQKEFDRITSLKSTEGGTRFFDKSALYHVHGEYRFNPKWTDEIRLGASGRLYTPRSEGTIFKDTAGTEPIRNFEFGIYGGIEKKFLDDRLIANVSARVDKNQNFNWVSTPAASLVWKPKQNNYLRLSFSSAVRNPTLTDQYLNLNVGRATLLGNLDGFYDLITVESFRKYLDDRSDLVRFDAPAIQPEKVKTFEVGYRTTLFEKVYVDAGYYYSFYNDFIGYNIGIYSDFDSQTGFPINTRVYRVAANSTNEVTTQGLAVGMNYYFADYYMIAGNYSWNKLNKTFADDPIIPAFNTPEHKYNISLSGRDVPINLGFAKLKKTGFNITYKWIQGFTFEGSPQFTGEIPTYDMLDAQVNATFDKIHTTVKIGASNILNNQVSQTYGGPRIGTMAYAAIVYDFVKK
ncbi:MAG: carboxypeptidase-like regulatory domain-containing protein [Saprospiraceae bacterium]|nr:carboxypeptidase-like regulatory domain-containing protein [Saprospiraceae bacterium]